MRFRNRFLRFFPSQLLLLILYTLVFTGLSLFLIHVTPHIVSEGVQYSRQIFSKGNEQLTVLNQRFNLNLDLSYIRDKILGSSSYTVSNFLQIFNNITKGIVYYIFALVLSFLFIHEQQRIEHVFLRKQDSLLSYYYLFIQKRICRFYHFFKQVMLGQVIISLINTLITTSVIFFLHLPYKVALIATVFVFGLIPVFGNLASNTIIVITALLNHGALMAVFCLVYLVIIHKLEYFLNSKIIGSIIKFPMFLTLITLIVGEALFGIAGLILAVPALLSILYELEHHPDFIEQTK